MVSNMKFYIVEESWEIDEVVTGSPNYKIIKAESADEAIDLYERMYEEYGKLMVKQIHTNNALTKKDVLEKEHQEAIQKYKKAKEQCKETKRLKRLVYHKKNELEKYE